MFHLMIVSSCMYVWVWGMNMLYKAVHTSSIMMADDWFFAQRIRAVQVYKEFLKTLK